MMGGLLLCLAGAAQTDTEPGKKTDTVKVGSIVIIKEGESSTSIITETEVKKHRHKYVRKKGKFSTNWIIPDIGFANYHDKTNYASAEAQNFVHGQTAGHPAAESDFALKPSSFNFNLWLFMQRMSLHKNYVNLKYGIGIDLNRYYYKSDIRYIDGTRPYVERQNVDMDYNRLSVDYVTVPLMLNINPNPGRKNGLSFSAGVSASYLYRGRNRQKADDFGKFKEISDFNFERWKLAYIAELGLGPVKLYGSYSITPLHQYGVNIHPYTVGVRLSGL